MFPWTVSRRAAPVLLAALLVPGVVVSRQAAPGLPDRLSDREFWALSQDWSEPAGYFRGADITNLTSNELLFQHVLPDLVSRVPPGRVYLGVGPEQNYTYMAALRPSLAVIFDVRRGNLDLQLMYKALFELSKDRAEFVSRLFAKPRPPGLGPSATAHDLFAAFSASETSQALYVRNLTAIRDHLTKTRGLPLPPRDLEGIEAVYRVFYQNGYYVRSSPSYWDLMTATDGTGVARGYLATEAAFTAIRDLQTRNLVVPVVGDFGGPRAIRAVGAFLKGRGARVGAFYLSNVEQYLYQDAKWEAFCANAASLPLDATSTFIRSSSRGGGGGRGGGFVNWLGPIAEETRACRAGGALPRR